MAPSLINSENKKFDKLSFHSNNSMYLLKCGLSLSTSASYPRKKVIARLCSEIIFHQCKQKNSIPGEV